MILYYFIFLVYNSKNFSVHLDSIIHFINTIIKIDCVAQIKGVIQL